jgi:hypothetical protein
MLGSVRGALSNKRPYRDLGLESDGVRCLQKKQTGIALVCVSCPIHLVAVLLQAFHILAAMSQASPSWSQDWPTLHNAHWSVRVQVVGRNLCALLKPLNSMECLIVPQSPPCRRCGLEGTICMGLDIGLNFSMLISASEYCISFFLNAPTATPIVNAIIKAARS